MSKFILDISTFQKKVFQLLIFLLPTQLAYHFWPNWSFVFGIRVDYLSPTIYFTDFLVCLLFTSEILNKKNTFKKVVRSKKFWPTISLITIFICLNILSSQNQWAAITKWTKILECLFIGYFVATNHLIKIREWILSPLQYSLVLFSSIGFLQFVNGHTFGSVFYLLGERSFGISTPGIALVDIFGRDYLRIYSTFPHPNSLAGYFSVAVLFILAVGFNNIKNSKVLVISLIFSVLTIILSFSLSSYFSLLIILFLFAVSRRSLKYFQMMHYLILLLIVLSVLLPLASKFLLQVTNSFPENIFNRLVLAESSGQILSRNIFTGIGLNNFIVALTQYLTYPRVSWWLQPVHNIILLIISEVGIIGLIAVVFLVNKTYLNLRKIDNQFSKILLLIIVFIALTGSADHYWFTIQQNILLLSIILGIIFNNNCLQTKIK